MKRIKVKDSEKRENEKKLEILKEGKKRER